MDRKEFLKLSGLAGAVSIGGVAGLRAGSNQAYSPIGESGNASDVDIMGGAECALIPSETAGPFPLNLSTDASKFRQDIREDQVGALTRLRMKIVSAQDCQPIANARVDIWHCNAYGYYSAYNTPGQSGNQDHTDAVWLRGIQMTDANGEVNFVTIFPGAYPGRTVHIHFQVFLSSVFAVTSQLMFPTDKTLTLLASEPPYSEWNGQMTRPESDGVFADGYTLQVATLDANSAEGGYDSFLQVAINAASTGLRNLEPETGGMFSLGQNYPNPYQVQTTVPFTLARMSNVTLDIFDLAGRKVTSVQRTNLPPGPQTLPVSLHSIGLADASYVYQLTVANSEGEFRQCKVMTRAR